MTAGHHEQPGRLHIQAGGDPAEVRRLPAARDPAALEQTLAALAAGWLPRSPDPGRRYAWVDGEGLVRRVLGWGGVPWMRGLPGGVPWMGGLVRGACRG